MSNDPTDATRTPPSGIARFEAGRANADIGKVVETPFGLTPKRVTGRAFRPLVSVCTVGAMVADTRVGANVVAGTVPDVSGLNPGLLSCANSVITQSSNMQATLIRTEPATDRGECLTSTGRPSGGDGVALIRATA